MSHHTRSQPLQLQLQQKVETPPDLQSMHTPAALASCLQQGGMPPVTCSAAVHSPTHPVNSMVVFSRNVRLKLQHNVTLVPWAARKAVQHKDHQSLLQHQRRHLRRACCSPHTNLHGTFCAECSRFCSVGSTKTQPNPCTKNIHNQSLPSPKTMPSLYRNAAQMLVKHWPA
jgi:hypothetical protein